MSDDVMRVGAVGTARNSPSALACAAVVGAPLPAVRSDPTDAVGGLLVFLAGATAAVCFFRIGQQLTRRPAPPGTSRTP